MKIDLRQAIYALSDMLDLVGVEEVHHGKRVGFMAWVCGEALGYTGTDLEFLFHAALLHDCGVSSTRTHQCLVDELLWDGAEEHCLIGAHRLQEFTAFCPMGPIIRFHHTSWTALQVETLTPRDAHFANLIFLLDRVDAMISAHLGKDLLFARDEIRSRLKDFSGQLFAPELVEIFLDVSSSEARIIAVADVFQALAQDRPYRPGKTPEQIVPMLRDQAQTRRLDSDIVELAALRPDHCREIATTPH